MKFLLLIAMLLPHNAVAVVQPFISCKTVSSMPANRTMTFVLNTNQVFPPPAYPADRMAKISFNGEAVQTFTMKPVTTAGTGTVYNYFKNHANLEVNLPLAKSTLVMSSALTRKFYTTAQLEYKNNDYFGFPYQLYFLECQPIKPFEWQY